MLALFSTGFSEPAANALLLHRHIEFVKRNKYHLTEQSINTKERGGESLAKSKGKSMAQENENVEPTPEAEPLPCSDPVTEAAALVTPNTPQVVPPKGVGVEEFKQEKLAEAAENNE